MPRDSLNASEPAKPVNVLILKSDEHNPFVTSVTGTPFVQTPNIAGLAARGTVFDSAYCPSPLCVPSRSSFLSGRPTHEIQVYNNCHATPYPNYPTYGGVLADQGVHTTFVGKVHAYRPADELGFSEMHGSETGSSGSESGSVGDASIRRVPLALRKEGPSRAARVGIKPSEREAFGAVSLDTTDYAIEFLTQRARDLGRPWTMEVNLLPPHFPHFVTQELWDLYSGHADQPAYGADQPSAQHPYAQDLRRHFDTGTMTPSVTAEHRRAYYGRITWVDRQLGRLLAALDQANLTDSTVVVYTSDHGEMLGKFGMWWKCSMFEDSVRVPLVVAGPGFSPGTRTVTPVTQWDLQASIFEAVQADRPADWLGEPLQGVPGHDDDRIAFAEYHGHGTRASAFMARQGPWKLIWNAAAPHQLFNIDRDPQELHDLAELHPEKVTELTRQIREHYCDPEKEQDRAELFIQQQLAALEAQGVPVS